MDLLGPEFLNDDQVQAAVAALDIGMLFRLVNRLGVSQRQIAGLTGQSQSEVCEILGGRQVVNVHVLRRIADGLGIPRARMFLGYGEIEPDPSPIPQEVDEDVKRRVLLAAGLSEPFLNLRSEPIILPLPAADEPLPTRLFMFHVRVVRTVTEQLRALTRYYGGQAGLFGDAVVRYRRWMDVPATDEVKAHLAAALAELHTEAGWARYECGLDGAGYFTRGMELADQAGDTYGIASAALHAGAALVRSGYPNDALKLFSVGTLRLGGLLPGKSTRATPPPDDARLAILTAQLNRQSATAYAVMCGTNQAIRHLAEANGGWEPQHAFERAGANLVNAGIQLDLGQLDTAEQSAASAARTYNEGHHRRGRTEAELMLAEVHVRTGEPQGLALARHAIAEVGALQSVAVRRERLIPLAIALEARPGTDTRELARKARQIATTRT